MANGELLGGLYPVTPYNFDVAPNPYLIGPLKSILSVVETRINQLFGDVAELQLQISVQNATGAYLDAHGALYGTPRLAGEVDNAYRPRILEAITRGKLTIAAILATVQNYERSLTAATGTSPTVDVYDLLSNPAKCTVDATLGLPIQVGDFVVEIDQTLSVNDAFFLDYTYLDDETYLIDAGVQYGLATDDLRFVVSKVQAGGTNAVFKNVLTFTP